MLGFMGDNRTMARKVLIVEDDEAMAVALKDGFTYEGYEVSMAADGALGLQKASEDGADLMILDVMLPKMTGLDVCKRLRGAGNSIPIIMLTARGQEIDKILGLKFGADDYVTKPFSFMELMARAEAVLRRSSGALASSSAKVETYSFGDVEIDFSRHEATKGGETIEMSPREYRLLEYFIEHRGEVVSRDQLLDSVWEYDNMPFTRTVDTHIAKLRKKVEDVPSDPKHIVTVHRLGYKFTG
jgi:DNA-binding response OmpR family regulator